MITCCLVLKNYLASYIAIHRIATAFRKENFGQENLGESFAIAKFAKIFSLQNFVYYGMCTIYVFSNAQFYTNWIGILLHTEVLRRGMQSFFYIYRGETVGK